MLSGITRDCDRDGPAAGRAFVNALIASALGDPALAVKARIRPRWTGPWPKVPRTQRCLEDAFPGDAFPEDGFKAQVLRPRAGRGLSPAAFRRDFVQPSRPVLLAELMDGWRCATAGGAAFVSALSDQRVLVGSDADGHSVSMVMRDFLRYAKNNRDRNPFLVFDSIIFDTLTATAARALDGCTRPWYTVPTIFSDDDLLQHLDLVDRPLYRWLLVGSKRSGSFVHTDPQGTCAWNALVSGAKHWVLFHPDTPREMLAAKWVRKRRPGEDDDGEEGEEGEKLDSNAVDQWDDVWGWFHEDLPGIKASVENYFAEKMEEEEEGGGEGKPIVRCFEFVQRPGEIVFLPSLWHHAVLNVEHSVAITQNFVDRENLELACAIMDRDGDTVCDGVRRLSEALRERLQECRPDLAGTNPGTNPGTGVV
jgi:histone arginine demethylase JMJD6